MQKIPTIFERDWDGDRSRVLDHPVTGTEWVFAGEGKATQKLDGSCCLISDNQLYKRHEVRPGKTTPSDFQLVSTDETTGKLIGWVPVGSGPEDKWHREAYEHGWDGDGTYELLGPKVQGDAEQQGRHVLIKHSNIREVEDFPRDFDGMRTYFENRPTIEGVVFHHPDGRMAKIKARDFGIKRKKI